MVARFQNTDPDRSNIEYLAECLAHEFNLGLKDLVEKTGALTTDTRPIERGLVEVAAAINNLAEAIREGNARR
jgi:hypothetical protein